MRTAFCVKVGGDESGVTIAMILPKKQIYAMAKQAK